MLRVNLLTYQATLRCRDDGRFSREANAGVGVVNHAVKLNRARVPVGKSGEGRARITRRVGFTDLDRESTRSLCNPPSLPPPPPPCPARGCTGRLGSTARCTRVSSPPLSLEINIALFSCNGRSCVAATDWSRKGQTERVREGCSE